MGEARFSAHVQTGNGAYPTFFTLGIGSFPGVKWRGLGVHHPPSSSAEVEVIVELYLLPFWAFVACYKENFVYIQIHIHTCIYKCTHTFIHTYICALHILHAYINTYIRKYIHTYICAIHILHTYIHTYVTYIYTYKHIRVYVHTYI